MKDESGVTEDSISKLAFVLAAADLTSFVPAGEMATTAKRYLRLDSRVN
jgi:hypothetical protein